jgi:adenylyl cyclase-associated protein
MPSILLSSRSTRLCADLLRRLEAATTRLEDIASSTIELPQAVPALQHTIASPPSGVSSASTPAPPAQSASAPAAPKMPPEPLPESIEDFDAFIGGSVEKFAKISNAIGGLIAEQVSVTMLGRW